jgi:hypothetical protein
MEVLAGLRLSLTAAGHGVPMRSAADQLSRLAENFPLPESGLR